MALSSLPKKMREYNTRQSKKALYVNYFASLRVGLQTFKIGNIDVLKYSHVPFQIILPQWKCIFTRKYNIHYNKVQ